MTGGELPYSVGCQVCGYSCWYWLRWPSLARQALCSRLYVAFRVGSFLRKLFRSIGVGPQSRRDSFELINLLDQVQKKVDLLNIGNRKPGLRLLQRLVLLLYNHPQYHSTQIQPVFPSCVCVPRCHQCEEDKGMPRGRSVNWENMARWKGQDSGTREVESSLYDSLGV